MFRCIVFVKNKLHLLEISEHIWEVKVLHIDISVLKVLIEGLHPFVYLDVVHRNLKNLISKALKH